MAYFVYSDFSTILKKLNNLLGMSKNYVYGKDIVKSDIKEK